MPDSLELSDSYHQAVNIDLFKLARPSPKHNPSDYVPVTSVVGQQPSSAHSPFTIPRKPVNSAWRERILDSHSSPSNAPTLVWLRNLDGSNSPRNKHRVQKILKTGEIEKPREVDDPQQWPRGRKVLHSIIPAVIAFLTTFASAIYVVARAQVAQELNASTTVSLLPYSLYILGIAFGPIIAAPLSEMYGRRPVYLYSVPLFAAFIAGAGASSNITSLVLCRMFAGFFASPSMSIGSATIADVWSVSDRAIPMAVYVATPFIGPTIGALVGGFVLSDLSWRWSQWLPLMLTGLVYPLALFMRETYHKVIMARKNQDNGPESWTPHAKRLKTTLKAGLGITLVRPLQMLLTEPMLALLCIYQFFVVGSYYMLIAVIPYVFRVTYRFNVRSQGLSYIPLLIGIVAGVMTVIYRAKSKQKSAEEAKAAGLQPQKPTPGSRLFLTMIAGPVLPVGLFWFGWSLRANVHWISAMFAMSFIAWATYIIIITLSLYTVDCYPVYAASATAATRVAGYAGGAIFPLFAIQMFRGMSNGWAVSLLGFIMAVLAVVPWAFTKYGTKVREAGRFERSHGSRICQ